MDKFTVIDIKTGVNMLPYTSIQTAAYENIYKETLRRTNPIDLTFSEDDHCYKYNGRKVISVTQVLSEVGISDFSQVPFDRLEKARLFGQAVHKACELYDKGTLDERNLDTNLWPYLDAWVSFKKDYQLEFIEIEKAIVSTLCLVAGMPDRIAKGDKQRRLGVLLTGEGSYKITEYKDRNDFNVFLSALSIINWKGKNNGN